jgi:hypothetical protein
VLALAGTSIVWLALAPVYASGLARVAAAVAPLLDRAPGARYAAEGSRVVVHRPVLLPGDALPRDLVQTLWLAAGAFGLPVFAAVVIVTPGWSWGTRARALAWGLAFLTLTQIVTVMVNTEFWQQMPVAGPRGDPVYLPGHSAGRLRVFSALFYFLEIMGRGFFALVTYIALLGLRERGRSRLGKTGRNEPCPCGSGRKFKRCCGGLEAAPGLSSALRGAPAHPARGESREGADAEGPRRAVR